MASSCSGKVSKLSTDQSSDIIGLLGAVHQHDPLREDASQLAVGAVDILEEGAAFALDPVCVAPFSGGRLLQRNDDQEGAIGQEPTRREEVELEHTLDPEPAREALVREGRVEVAVADDVRAAGQRGPDHLVDQLCPGGGEERRLGPGTHGVTGEQELPDPLPEGRSPRFADVRDVSAFGRELLCEKARLCRLPGAVHTFEADEHGRRRRIRPVRAIVTGGAGFIGSHVVDMLVARGAEVAVLDDLSQGRRENVNPAAELLVVDVRDPVAVNEAFATVQPEACFHLAAQADVRVSVARPDFDCDVNVIGTIRLLEAARAHGTRVVLASTGGAIYGECDEPADETAPTLPLAPYGTSKLAAEEYLATYNRLYGSSHTALRYGNVYGPRQDPHGEAGVVAIFFGRLAHGERPHVYGDGSQERDYVYVEDVARVTVAALEKPAGVFNIGTGVAVSVLRLLEACLEVSGVSAEPVFDPPRPGELQRSVLDPTLARRELGFTPSTALGDGLAATWDSIRAEGERQNGAN